MSLANQLSILGLQEILGSNESLLDRFSNSQVIHKYLKGLIGNNIGLLLAFIRVNKECAASHDIHITVLSTSIQIDGLRVELVLVRLYI